MNAKTVGTVVLLAFVAVSVGYLIVSELKAPSAADPATETPAAQTVAGQPAEDVRPAEASSEELAAAPGHKIVAYYFHNTQRCTTCLKIERLAEEALREQFAPAFEKGELEWRTVNMEEPPNEHYVLDYQLVASSLVLVDLHDGEQRDWTNMDKVWQFVHDDEAAFKQYVAEQAREYLES